MTRSVRERDGTNVESLSAETLFDVLANRRRRFVVDVLERTDGPVDVGTLSEAVAASEYGIDRGAVSYEQRRGVHTTLQQSHLPRMVDVGVVEFDRERGVVAPRPALHEVEIYLDVVRGTGISWSTHYLGVAALSASILGGAWVDLWPFTGISDLSWAVMAVAAFATTAVVHAYTARVSRVGRGQRPPGAPR